MEYAYAYAYTELVAGDADDRAAELEELVVAHHAGSGQSAVKRRPPAAALRLLRFVEDGEKWLRFLRRDYASLLEGEDDGAVQTWTRAAIKRRPRAALIAALSPMLAVERAAREAGRNQKGSGFMIVNI